MSPPPNTKRLLLLGGGTVLGAAQCYPLQRYFKEQGFPHTVVGSSIGSVGAAALSVGILERLEEIWRSINSTSDFQSLNLNSKYAQHKINFLFGGLFNFNPLYKLMIKEIGNKVSHCEAYAAAVNLADKTYNRLPLHNVAAEDRALHVVASCAQVPIHSAPLVDNNPMGDGGILHVIPRMPEEWNEITVIACSPISTSRTDNVLKSSELGLMRSLEIALDQHELLDYVWLLKQAQTASVCIVEPSERPGKPFDASKNAVRKLLDEVGPRAWENRYYLPQLSDSDILRICLS